MIRRFFLTLLLVVAGFAAGMVVTGRMRIADDSFAQPSPPAARETAPQRAGAPAPAAASSTTPAPTAGLTGGPDFTHIAGQAV
jgi:hypothetical protein